MKAISIISKSLFVGIILTFSSGLYAQDMAKDAMNGHSKVILDNEKVTVIQVEFTPGYVVPMHQDPENVGYVLAGGKMEITEEGKEAKVMELKEGDAMYMAPETHALKNVGTTTVKLIVTILKPVKMKNNETSMKDESSDM